MYADRRDYAAGRSSGIDPRSLGIAVLVNGAVVAALMVAPPAARIPRPDPPLHTYAVPLPPPPAPPPPPPPPKPVEQHTAAHQPLTAPRAPIDLPPPVQPAATGEETLLQPQPTAATGLGLIPEATPTPAPLTTLPAEIDPAHRADLQPPYPADELRAEHEGVVVVKILIGVDGRVRQVERLGATSDGFFRATETQALRRWRFRPASRGGVPVEAWRTMTIRFVMPR